MHIPQQAAVSPTERTMSDQSSQADHLQQCLDRLRAGDPSARDELIRAAADRLTRLTRTMLRDHPRLRRWEDTDDVFQSGVLRLCNALRGTVPGSVAEFFRLAALVLRRELIDLARQYFGPEGMAAHHASKGPTDESAGANDPGNTTLDPKKLAAWTEFHEQIGALPDEERDMFDLLWYHGLSQAEAATLLGVSERTVQRRWQAARLKIYEALRGEPPG
jgi:RNA polymerase sigma factor (sigma-70 family)